jgi:hypothetical protein
MNSTADGLIIKQLKDAHEALCQRVKDLEKELAASKASIPNLAALIEDLENKSQCIKAASKRKAANPAASKSLVVESICQVLKENKALPLSELEKQTEKNLVESGYSRIGFALRFQEACKDPQFVKTSTGLAFKPTQTTHTVSTSVGSSSGQSISTITNLVGVKEGISG